jgi:diguanylate cyclase (GGDEF)-like protein
MFPCFSLLIFFEYAAALEGFSSLQSQGALNLIGVVALFAAQLGTGYFFYLAEISKKKFRFKSELLIHAHLTLFIAIQFVLYLDRNRANDSFSYYICSIAAVCFVCVLHTKYAAFFLALNFLAYSYSTGFKASGNEYFYAASVNIVGILFSGASYQMKINALYNSSRYSQVVEQMALSNAKLANINAKLEELSVVDELTKLYNRHAFDRYLERAWSQAARSGTPVAIMLLDIDKFKEYNEYFGREQGDDCLVKVADRIRDSFRRKSDIAARFSGDEFAIAAPMTNFESAKSLAGTLIKDIEDLKMSHPANPASKYVTVSVGFVSLVPSKEITLSSAFQFADKALYQAKTSSRNKFCYGVESKADFAQSEIFKEIKGGIFTGDVREDLRARAVFFFFLDYAARRFEISPEFYDMVNLKPSFATGLSDITECVYDEDKPLFEMFAKNVFEPGFTELNLNFRIVIKNNDIVNMNCLCFTAMDGEGKPSSIIGTLRDIDNETHREEIVEKLLDANFMYLVKEKTGIITGPIVNRLAIPAQGAIFDFSNWREAIYADDRVILDSFLGTLDQNDSDVAVLEYRIVLADNSALWISNRNKIYRNNKGEATSVSGVIINLECSHRNQIDAKNLVNTVSGLPDRLQFYRDFEAILENKHASGYLYFMDIDNFSGVSAVFGYASGNKFLKAFSYELKNSMLYEGKIYHFESDLFAVIFSALTPEQAERQLRNFKDVDKSPIMLDGHKYEYSVSAVAIEYPKYGVSVDEILRNNDIALRKIKREGKNNTLMFTQLIFEENANKIKMGRELRDCVNNNMRGFTLYYHPLLNASTRECVGSEALIRWQNSEGRIIYPNDFLPLLEELGLMHKVDDWVLRKAAYQIKHWLKRSKNETDFAIAEDFSMNVNLSPQQLAEENFVDSLINYLSEIGLPPKHLTLEITENSLIMDINKTAKILKALRRRGLKVAIDDFGTGYSSLSYFRDLPVDEIKIDRSFVVDIEEDYFCQQFVDSIIKITQSVNRIICIEGVETEYQANLLTSYSADILQGYLFSKPIPRIEFERGFLKKQEVLVEN